MHLSNLSLLSSTHFYSSVLRLLYPLTCLYPPLSTSPAPGPVSVLPVLATACGEPPGAGGTPHTRGAVWCWQCAHAPSGSAKRLRWICLWTRLGSCPHIPPAASWSGSVETLGALGSRGGEVWKNMDMFCAITWCHLFTTINNEHRKTMSSYLWYSWYVGVISMIVAHVRKSSACLCDPQKCLNK